MTLLPPTAAMQKLLQQGYAAPPAPVFFRWCGDAAAARAAAAVPGVPPDAVTLGQDGIGRIDLAAAAAHHAARQAVAAALARHPQHFAPLLAVRPPSAPWNGATDDEAVRALAGRATVVDLPFEPTDAATPRAVVRRPFDAGADASLAALRRSYQAAPEAAVLTAILAAVYKHTSQDDFLIGYEEKASGYVLGLEEPALIPFPGGRTPLGRLLQDVGARLAARRGLADWPAAAATLTDELLKDRHPLLQVAGVVLGADLPADAAVDAALAASHSEQDLAFTLFAGAARPGLALTYDARRFPAAYAERLLAHVTVALALLAADPALPVEALSLTTPAELALLDSWNRTAAPRPDGTLVDALRRHAAEAPAGASLVGGGESVTNAALDARSDAVARGLLALGVGPGDTVGLWLDRSHAFVVALWGVLKTGAAFLPLDLAYPADRLGYIIEQSGARLLLTSPAFEPPPLAGAPLAALGDVEARGAASKGPLPAVAPGATAYVIYTSGSTGRPKGVECTHAGVLNLIADFERLKPLARGDVAATWSSFSFDASIYEIFAAAVSGCALAVVPEKIRPLPQRYFSWLEEHAVAHAYVPPMMLKELAEAVEAPGARFALKRLMVGVEPIAEALLARIQAAVPGLRIVNAYGPTEATVIATRYLLPAGARPDRRTPIGSPVANMQAYVVDDGFRRQPPGVFGELLIGGAGVATGYLAAPDLTAGRFVPDLFGGDGGRLYRSGDVVRFRQDGQLEFKGRADFQVKIQGFRIELGEVEAALLGHPGVLQAVVVAGQVGANPKALVAYVVPSPAVAPTSDALRAHLGERLPQYMVPSAFIILDALPQLPSGKVDRKRLPPVPAGAAAAPPAPVAAGSAAPDPGAAPLAERILAACREAFGTDQVDPQQNFFDAGATSIGLAKLLAALNADLGCKLKLPDLYRHTTVERLAAHLAKRRG